MGCDVIGDVHGQDRKLRALLAALGYRERLGAWRHPAGRQAVFVGDLIDRGPGQREVVGIARKMCDAGSARVVMGNHELNAIGYATRSPDGGWLRPHSRKNEDQHREFLAQVGWETPVHRDMVAWFRTLPVALDLGGLRVCHAWWDAGHVAAAAAASGADGRLSEEFLLASFDRREAAYTAMEGLTKGLEVPLPPGHSIVDHGNQPRGEIRVRWWDHTVTTYRDAALVADDQRDEVPDAPFPPDLRLGNPSPVPVFVGHYWLTGTPAPQNVNTAVLDYSAGLDGPLVAYRWDGEGELRIGNFVAAGG